MADTFLCNRCNQNKLEKKWLPNSVSNLEDIIENKIQAKQLRKNIVYNLQYLEFLNECTAQLNLTSVLYSLTYKNFIIISVGIIEGILFHEINKQCLQKRSIWKFVKKILSNEAVLAGNKKYRVETSFFEKLDNEKNEDMRLEQMISIAEAKFLLGQEHNIYTKLNALRKLRNKIHLHLFEHDGDTDFKNYNYNEIKLSKKVLLDVLKLYFQLPDNYVGTYFSFLVPKEQSVSNQTEISF